MGFLRFLGKNDKPKAAAADELDVPPLPPESMGLPDLDLDAPFPGDELPQMPQNFMNIPNAPTQRQQMQFSSPKEQEQKEPTFPYPSAQPAPTSAPTIQKTTRPIPSNRQTAPIHPQEHYRGPTFIRADQFSKIMQDLGDARQGLIKTSQDLESLSMDSSGKDKAASRYKSTLNDIQRRLVAIDKMLFKGEAK